MPQYAIQRKEDGKNEVDIKKFQTKFIPFMFLWQKRQLCIFQNDKPANNTMEILNNKKLEATYL